MPKVSVIIPVYNVEKYLEECLESVLAQTLHDLEILCVNDGSTDGSPEILRAYEKKDGRIHIIDQPNGGYGKAMNAGLLAAKGEYIGIVEPDDVIPPEMYQELYEKAAENRLDFVKADFYRFRGGGEEREYTYVSLSENKEDYGKVFDPSMHPETLHYIMNTWSGIYRSAFLREHHILHNETPGASYQDNGFYFQTFAFGKRAMIVNKAYYRNRRDNPGSSVKSREKVYCINEEYDFIRKILKKDPQLWERFQYDYWKKKFSNYKATAVRIAPAYRREYVYRICAEFNGALKRGELDFSIFSPSHREALEFLMKDPEGYLFCLQTDCPEGAGSLKRSKEYLAGLLVYEIPHRVKAAGSGLLKQMLRNVFRKTEHLS